GAWGLIVIAERSQRSRAAGRPTRPGDDGQQQRERAETIPGLGEALSEKQRHKGTRSGDAEADTGEDRAARDTAPPMRYVRQHDRRREYHQRTAGNSGQQPPDEEPLQGDG